ncbi:MAG: PilZ domain-containing protein [Terriglobia bacterium]
MAPGSSEQRRRSPRVSATFQITLMLEGKNSKTKYGAYTVDLSKHGARIRTTFMLFPGMMVEFVPWGDEGQSVSSCVVWVKRSEYNRGSVAGIEFLETFQASADSPSS